MYIQTLQQFMKNSFTLQHEDTLYFLSSFDTHVRNHIKGPWWCGLLVRTINL